MTGTSEDAVATALRAVIADYGWNLTTHPARLRAALSDQLAGSGADYRAAIDALVVAADEGIASKLRSVQDPAARAEHVSRLREWGLSEQAAGWSVATWAAAVPWTAGAPSQPWTAEPTVPDPLAVPSPTLPDPAAPYVPPPPPALPQPHYPPVAAGWDPTALPPAAPGWTPPPSHDDRTALPSTALPSTALPAMHGMVGTPPGLRPTELPPGAWVDPQYPGHPASGPPTSGHPAPGHPDPGRRSARRTMLIAAAVVAVLGLGAGGYFVFSGDEKKAKPVGINLGGKAVDQPEVALAATESIVAGLVKRRHGVASRDLRCYYGQSAAAKSTDVDVENRLFCGPVLFVDGVVGLEYLEFALKAQPKGNEVAVSPADTPTHENPAAIPAGVRLVRPDGATAPPHGTLKVPNPPPATGDELVVQSQVTPTPAEPTTAPVMGAQKVGVKITAYGLVERYGSYDDARSAPTGGKLVAFRLEDGPCDGNCGHWNAAGLTLEMPGSTPRALPAAYDGDYYVAALPGGVDDANLVLNKDGYRQTLSVVTGRPGAQNIKMMQHQPYAYQAPKKVFKVRDRTSIPLSWNGRPSSTLSPTITLNVSYAVRYFFLNGKTPRSPGNAFLYVRVGYRYPGLGADQVIDDQFEEFIDSAGHHYKARDLDPSKYVQYVFEVPATVLSGTLVLGGRGKFVSTTGKHYTETMPIRRVSIRLS